MSYAYLSGSSVRASDSERRSLQLRGQRLPNTGHEWPLYFQLLGGKRSSNIDACEQVSNAHQCRELRTYAGICRHRGKRQKTRGQAPATTHGGAVGWPGPQTPLHRHMTHCTCACRCSGWPGSNQELAHKYSGCKNGMQVSEVQARRSKGLAILAQKRSPAQMPRQLLSLASQVSVNG